MKQIIATSDNVEYRIQVSARPTKEHSSEQSDKIQRHYNWLCDLARDTACFSAEEVKEHSATLRSIDQWGTSLNIEQWLEIMALAYKVFDSKIETGELNIAQLESQLEPDTLILAMLKNTVREMRASKEEVLRYTKAMVLEMARITDSIMETVAAGEMNVEVTA
ncbi:MAG: hypothetical protein ACO3VQ_02460 [Ilumatobacteraceae bacterium]